MGLFSFFSNKNIEESPIMQFGRFSDSFKSKEKYDAWDLALSNFEKGNLEEAYAAFFYYLSDEKTENISVTKEGNRHRFNLFQGSKLIKGEIFEKTVKAEAKIAATSGLNIGFLRKLLEENYQLKYCRYALDENDTITIVFTAHCDDASPYKLYYSLKELATCADKKDDLLIGEFENLSPINQGHIKDISEKEKNIKYQYTQDEISKANFLLDNTTLNVDHYPGAVSYIYLDLAYRLDYLVKPEGQTMEIIESIDHLYFKDKTIKPTLKNSKMKNLLKSIGAISSEEFYKEIYEVKSTFGVSQSSGQNRIQEFIASEIKKMDWYHQNGHLQIASAIPSYIVGYCLFNYSMPAPLRELFHVFYEITQNEYFSKLGFKSALIEKNSFKSSKIKDAIRKVISGHEIVYPHLSPKWNILKFNDDPIFRKTYLLMLLELNFTRSDNR